MSLISWLPIHHCLSVTLKVFHPLLHKHSLLKLTLVNALIHTKFRQSFYSNDIAWSTLRLLSIVAGCDREGINHQWLQTSQFVHNTILYVTKRYTATWISLLWSIHLVVNLNPTRFSVPRWFATHTPCTDIVMADIPIWTRGREPRQCSSRWCSHDWL